jgi:hypothetical protein
MTRPAVCSPVAAAAAAAKPHSDTGVRGGTAKFAVLPDAGSETGQGVRGPGGHGSAAGQAVPIAWDVTSGEGG